MNEETILQNDIRVVLSDAGIVLRNNVGTFITPYGKPVRIGIPGEPDLTLLTKTGKTIFIEIKTPKGRLSAKQKHFRETVEGYGFRFEVLRSVDEARALVQEVLNEL